MQTRSKTRLKKEEEEKKIDINNLPKEALFQLLLQVEPKEIKIVCHSKNPRVRQICSSGLFQEAYKKKYPKKLLDFFFTNMGRDNIEMIGKNKDIIRVVYNPETQKLKYIEFRPHNQIFPSTTIPENRSMINLHLEFRNNNPIQIVLFEDDGEMKMTIGRDDIGEISTKKDEEKFRENYNQEVKEFLQSIERENWWNPNIQYQKNEVSKQSMNEFYNQVLNLMRESKSDDGKPLIDIYYPKLV